jgi:polyisoprenoid-binding protein YceI
MLNFFMKMFLGLLIFSTLSLMAKPIEYQMGEKSWATFDVPYSLGVHNGKTLIDHVTIVFDPLNPQKMSGEIVIPIARMSTGNPQRDCHLREALGLNYDQSEFPANHVCDKENQLPTSGKNAVVYPYVIFNITGVSAINKDVLSSGKAQNIFVDGEWTIHGVKKKDKIQLQLTLEKGMLKAQGDKPLSLKDFNIIVKSGKFLFVTISVKPEIRTHFDLVLKP